MHDIIVKIEMSMNLHFLKIELHFFFLFFNIFKYDQWFLAVKVAKEYKILQQL